MTPALRLITERPMLFVAREGARTAACPLSSGLLLVLSYITVQWHGQTRQSVFKKDQAPGYRTQGQNRTVLDTIDSATHSKALSLLQA